MPNNFFFKKPFEEYCVCVFVNNLTRKELL